MLQLYNRVVLKLQLHDSIGRKHLIIESFTSFPLFHSHQTCPEKSTYIRHCHIDHTEPKTGKKTVSDRTHLKTPRVGLLMS